MLKNKIIEDGIYEIKDISFTQKIFPLIFAYMKYDIKFDILMTIPILVTIYVFLNKKVDILPYICILILIEFIIFFAISRLLVVKNKKIQYMKKSGNIIKLITNDLKLIEGYKLSNNYSKIYTTGNITTIILEAQKMSRNIIIKSAITIPSKCIENKIVDRNVIDNIKAKEKEIYDNIMNSNTELDLKKANSIRDILENERQDFNNKYNIK